MDQAVGTAQTVRTARSSYTRLKNFIVGTAAVFVLSFGYLYVTDTRAGVHQWLVIPSLRWFYSDAEDAHEAGTRILKALYAAGVHPRERGDPDAVRGDLRVEVFGHELVNPIATSAGIDKHADVPDALLSLGPAIVEIGGTTPLPQEGNPKPRVFRIPSQNALINRYGLNSEGADHVAMRLRQRVREFAYAIGLGIDELAEQKVLDGEAGVPPGSLFEGRLLAIQVAKNKTTPDQDIEAVKRDYVYCVDRLARYADVVVVNVSSPNTPGLRGLQKVEPLTDILKDVVRAAKSVQRKTKPAVMVKVSPDEDSEEEIQGICQAVWESNVDGVIVGNTTKKRPAPLPAGYLLSPEEASLLDQEGGYSGPQMFERTLALVKKYRRLLDRPPGHEPQKKKPRDSDRSIPTPATLPTSEEDTLLGRIEASVARDEARIKDPGTVSNQPLLQLPERNSVFGSSPEEPSMEKALSASTHLEQGAPVPSSSTQSSTPDLLSQKIEASVERDKARLKEPGTDSSQPLIRLPDRNTFFGSPTEDKRPPSTEKALSASTHVDQGPPVSSSSSNSESSTSPGNYSAGSKVIFATGGITNGKQALEVLNAGASVAMVYTALVYGGVGTITRIKDEMRAEMKKGRKT